MKISQKIHKILLAGLIAAAIAAPAFADDTLLDDGGPHPLRQGDITYITGGVSDEDRDALEATANAYNLKVTNANRKSEYVIHVNVVIMDQNGQEKLSATNVDPLLYVDLPPGNYNLIASKGAKQQKRKITIGAKKQTEVNLFW